jgi:hypothetical protein
MVLSSAVSALWRCIASSQLLQPVTWKNSQQEEDEADGAIVAIELEYSKITVSCETLY